MKVWRVEFGSIYSGYDVVAQTVREAVEKAEKFFLEAAARDRKDSPEDKIPVPAKLLREEPVTSVELIAEAS